jgi:hypothetical protein
LEGSRFILLRRKTNKIIIVNLLLLILLILPIFHVFSAGFTTGISEANASQSISASWFYNEWQYRKMHSITRQQVVENVRFFDLSSAWTTISGNPTQRHAFQPVHNAAIMEVDKTVDGNTWKYLAYDSNAGGSQIRLYYTNDTAGVWTPYSANPILSSGSPLYRWPSTTYVNGTFYMFLTNMNSGTLERWTSVNGINYVFSEIIKTGGNQYKNPYIWNNPNDNKWYLYTHDSSGATESIKVRNSSSIENLDIAPDTIVVSRNIPFGSPTVMFYDGKYWLLAEAQIGTLWRVVAYYSKTSPSSGFSELSNSPILSNDEACPMLLLTPNQTKAYLFISRNSSIWYQETHEVYLNSTTAILSAAVLTNYQVRIKALYGSGIDNGENVYLNNNSKTDFGDVRFTWYNSSALSEVPIDYWVEELKTAQSAVFWLKIPEISSMINNTIYVYYGKDDALSASNGTATFDFFDDFSGTLSKWTVIGGTWTIENGELNAQTTATPYGQRLRATNFSFGNNSVHVKEKWISGTYFEHGPYVRGQQPNEQTNGYMTFLSTWTGGSRNRISKLSGGVETTLSGQGTTNPSTNVWYTCVFSLYANNLRSSINPLYQTEITGTDSTFSNGTLSLFSWSGASEHVHYDDLFVTKYAYPEPSHSAWGGEETAEYINIDQAVVSDPQADVGSVQKVSIHAKWNNNNSDVVGGTIFVNSTGYLTNATGWITFNANSSVVGRKNWIITGVNCGGVTAFTQTASIPNIIWDEIEITAGSVTKNSVTLGENTTIWFKAIYGYDDNTFDGNDGFLYVNDTQMLWSSANNRWEYVYTANVMGATSFRISQVSDNLYNLTMINDAIGNQIVTSWYSPFSITSNSTVSDIVFNSTSRVLSFTVSGSSGTTGFTNATIAKTLISDINSLEVYVDGNQTTFNINDLTYSWLIHFAYQHSTHKVAIVLGSPPAESSTALSSTPASTNPPANSPSTYPSSTNPSSVSPSTNSSSVNPLSINPSLTNLPFNPINMALSLIVATLASAMLIIEVFRSRRSDGNTQTVRKYSAHTRRTSKATRRSPQRKFTKTN